ncbi:hypothetical protein PENSPDRAFT_506122 [Peniophora sp. CONT]|nr:hypothetical protein PENSPDRAFT_506122 [Peniophora sp. CONT]
MREACRLELPRTKTALMRPVNPSWRRLKAYVRKLPRQSQSLLMSMSTSPRRKLLSQRARKLFQVQSQKVHLSFHAHLVYTDCMRAGPTHEVPPTRRSTISPIPEREDESRASNASPASEEPEPTSASPEHVPVPLAYIPLPSSIRSGTPSPEDVFQPASAVPSQQSEQPNHEHVSQLVDDNAHDATQEPAPSSVPVPEAPVEGEAPKRATPPPADEEPTSVPVPEPVDPHVAAEEAKKQREENEAKAREDAIWAEFERETKARDETAKGKSHSFTLLWPIR